jgi:hypothetical protein
LCLTEGEVVWVVLPAADAAAADFVVVRHSAGG